MANGLLSNQFFYPDQAATSQYLTDLTRALHPSGSATVICSASTYAAAALTEAPPPARVIRLDSPPFARGRRMASYATFLAAATWAAFRTPKPDYAVTLTTPPLLSLLGLALQSLRGARHIIWEMDMYPDIAVDLGVLNPRSPITRLLRLLADLPRRRADAIIALGECMKTRLLQHGVPESRIHIVENWADGVEITPAPFPQGPIVLHYSGNLGLAHDEATLRSVIAALAGHPRFHFLISGGGARRDHLETWSRAHNIPNLEFRPYCDRAQLSASLAAGHIGLVTQLPETVGSIVPSKTYGIMAAGRPVLYIGPPTAQPARVIERHNCGWHFNNGDTQGILSLLHLLAGHPEQIHQAGRHARQAFESHYDRPIAVAKLRTILDPCPSV